jgi:hypothetical protein
LFSGAVLSGVIAIVVLHDVPSFVAAMVKANNGKISVGTYAKSEVFGVFD